MTYFLGIDGGGSGCRAAIAGPDGRILGTGSSGPANIATDAEGAVGNILAATKAALGAAGLNGKIGGLRICLGLAGANAAGVADRLLPLLPFRKVRLVTDAETTARGALAQANGVVAAIGTGSVFIVQNSGLQRVFGGWGFLMGDEGSGARMGQVLLSRTLQSVDGRRVETPLLRAVLNDFHGAAGIVQFAAQARPSDFASLAPRILSSADPEALSIITEFVSDVAEMIDFLQPDPPLPVVIAGGLGAFYRHHLSTRWDIVAARGSALDGAISLALEMA